MCLYQCSDCSAKGIDPRYHREIGRGLERVGESGLFQHDIKCLGPKRACVGGDARLEYATPGWPIVDAIRAVDRAGLANGIDDILRHSEQVVWVQFVQIKAGGFPVLVQADAKIELGQAVDPFGVRPHLAGLDVAIVAVEIDAGPVFTGVVREAGRVETGTGDEADAGRPGGGLNQPEHGQRPCRFIAVDAGGNVNGQLRILG